MENDGKTKVLMAQFPLETHSREIIEISGMLTSEGMEAIIMGNALPQNIIERAIQESANVVGICTFSGGEIALGNVMMKAAKDKGIKKKTAFIIGGIIAPDNVPKLKKMGFDAVFLTAMKDSGSKEEIISSIQNAIEEKKNPKPKQVATKKAATKKASTKKAAVKKVAAKKAAVKKVAAKKIAVKKIAAKKVAAKKAAAKKTAKKSSK
ncbi:MAG: cobalamin-dependent protein [Smithellaceae bacterium]